MGTYTDIDAEKHIDRILISNKNEIAGLENNTSIQRNRIKIQTMVKTWIPVFYM